MQRILITGTAGFLGARILEKCMNLEMFVLSIDKKLVFLPEQEGQHLSLDLGSIEEIQSISAENIDIVIHAASTLPFGATSKQIQNDNIQAIHNVIKVVRQTGAFFVYVSSSSVYGRPESCPITPQTSENPVDEYGHSKLSAEKIIAESLPMHQYAIVRPRTILGAGRSGIFQLFFRLIAQGIPLPLPGGGRQVLQFVHVDDVAEICLHLAKTKQSGTWPAAAPNPKALSSYLCAIEERVKEIKYFTIPPKIFGIVGTLLTKLKLLGFTSWHYSAFPFDSYFDDKWRPDGFIYLHTSEETFLETGAQLISEKLDQSYPFWHRFPISLGRLFARSVKCED